VNTIEIKFSDAGLVAKFLQLLVDITKHPDITPELKEYVERETVAIIETDEDLSKWVRGVKRIK